MINLSLDEPRLVAQIRNINDYENKSKEDLTKALTESDWKPEPKTKTKSETKPKQTPKPETKPEKKYK